MALITLAFDQVFRKRDDGTFTPRRCVYVGSIAITPGMRLQPGMPHAGFDVASYAGRHLSLNERDDGSLELRGCASR